MVKNQSYQSRSDHWVYQHSLEFLYGNSGHAVFGSLVAMLCLAFALSTEVAPGPLLIWTVVGVIIGLTRIYLWYGFSRFRSRYTDQQWFKGYRLMSAASGLLAGISMWLFFDQLTFAYKLIIPLYIVGLTAASLGTHAVDRMTFLSFTVIACGLATLKFLFAEETSIQVVGVMYVLYIIVMARAGQQTYNTLKQNFELTYSMHFRATRDPLCGLLNREEFEHQFERLTPRHENGVAMLFIDLDNFKPLNDTLGHQAGDEALMRVADIIRSSVRANDISARLGGDEFVILLFLDQVGVAEDIAQRILEGVEAIEFPVEQTIQEPGASAHGADFRGLSASIGIAYHYRSDVLFSQLMRVADIACYRSKERGKNQITVLDLSGSPALDMTGS